MVTYGQLKTLLADNGFGNLTAITHVGEGLRAAGMISTGARTPMTTKDVATLILGMSTLGKVSEKLHNVEALMAMESQEGGAHFGAYLMGCLDYDQDLLPTVIHDLTIYPDTPAATCATGSARGATHVLSWGRDLEPHRGPLWSVTIGTAVLRRIGKTLL